MKIALLEDNPSILDYLSRALEMIGHSVQTYTSSAPLLETLFRGDRICAPIPYDLLLVDLLLPGAMSGIETIHTIRRAISQECLPIIVVSACSPKELERAQLELPQVPMLRKPFKIMELQHLIDEVQCAS